MAKRTSRPPRQQNGATTSAQFRSRKSAQRSPPATPRGLIDDRQFGQQIVIGRRRQQRIDFRLALGDITQVSSRAAVIGIFQDVPPGGAAHAIDLQLEGAISNVIGRNMFSAAAGEIFILPAGRHRFGPELVVFVGMGRFDEFDASVLRLASENVARTLLQTKVEDFATVILGASSGLALEDALGSVVRGFFQGILDCQNSGSVRQVTLCENDQQRYERIRQEMLRLSTTPLFDEMEVTLELTELPNTPPRFGPAARQVAVGPRVPEMYLMVRRMTGAQAAANDNDMKFCASLLTAGQRATVMSDTIVVRKSELRSHLESIDAKSFDFRKLPGFGEELANLVLPSAIQHALASHQDHPLVVIHDAQTSMVPWETLCIDSWAPAVAAGMSRKYSATLPVAKWLESRRRDGQLKMLLIINPTEDLEGADQEGEQLRSLAERSGIRFVTLRGSQATTDTITTHLRSGEYDVLHYAGHAFFDSLHPGESGIVCHRGQVLAGSDLARIERLPALAFFNACEAARVRGKKADVKSTRILENVGLAEAFLRGGVANYVGTHWPVKDHAAATFAETFYRRLMDTDSIQRALLAARTEVYAMKLVDWADYVHFGSPNFRLKLR